VTTTDWGPVRRASNLVWLPVILLSTYFSGPPGVDVAVAVAASVVAAAAWIVAGLRLSRPAWLEPVAIVALGPCGIALISAFDGWSTPVAFCFYAVLAAAARLPSVAAVALLVANTVGVVIVLHAVPASALLVIALGMAAVFLLGMGRRETQRRAERRDLELVAEARLREEHARADALAERARVARDVHDVLAHSLSALTVQLQVARLMLLRDGAPADTLAQIERAQQLATEGLAEARRAVTTLRAGTPDPGDVADGLRALIAETPGAVLEIDGIPAGLGVRERETLLRTAQEALSNARRHAAGAPVSVRLRCGVGGTELEVRDRPGSAPVRGDGGYGLVGMAERAALAGAHLDAGPTEDGWRVHLQIPAPGT
jgi:signal transduction histidine kinase